MMTTNLENYYSQLSKYTPNGSQTLSKMPNRYPAVYPKWIVKGSGGKVYDHNGHEYVDLISGLGAIAVGYANDYIDNAAYRQMRQGTLFSLPSLVEYEAAKRLTELVPGTEQWKFGKNGTDGTVMAVRAARALTGRLKFISVGYNGCADLFECRGTRRAGIPEILKYFNLRATYNCFEHFEPLVKREYACVIMESRVFEEPAPGFLEWIRKLCTDTGTFLIFDEVVNGGRYQGYTSANYYQVVPDLYVLGKGLANGFPLCAVGGRRSVMEVFERDDFFASGTFGGECVSLAAFMETSKILQSSIPGMILHGLKIQEYFNSLSSEASCVGYPTRLNFKFPTEGHKFLFWQEMCKRGVLVGYANFVKADNTDAEIDFVCDAIESSLIVLKENWENPKNKLIGAMPTEALKGRSN